MRFEIFPQQALDASIITPVLLGLFLLFLFTELFGWVFVGYVVPGYLAAVFLTFPESGVAIVFEAILTYVLVIWVSEGGAKLGLWARFFGRERFLLFVYVSVVVRLIMESIVLSQMSSFIQSYMGITLENEFFSIGLVLVPLLANAFWKTGLAKGLAQSGFISLLTYVFLAYVLIPYTNLNVSKFELTYENLALDFTASPKLYIILLTGAFLASTYNLRYGWDYNGIMMPALIAIAFFMPAKLISTCGEAVVVSTVFNLLTKLPLIRDINFGGGRRILGVFFVGYLMKWILAVYFPAIPTMGVSDFFGFGYLLPSLLGVKILQKRNAWVVLLPTLNAALYAVVLGSIIAAGFQLLSSYMVETEELDISIDSLVSPKQDGLLFQDLLTSKAYVLSGGYVDRHKPFFNQTLWASETIIRAIESQNPKVGCSTVTSILPPSGAKPFECLHRFDKKLGDYLIIRERVESQSDRRGQGVYVIRPYAKGPILQVPYPKSEPFSVEAAYIVAEISDARAIVLAGFDEPLSKSEWADATRGRGTVFQRLYESLGEKETVQIRTVSGRPSTLYARRSLPYSLNLNVLRSELGALELSWVEPLDELLQWNTSHENVFSVLELKQQTVYRIFPKKQLGDSANRLQAPISLMGLIERWLVEQKDFIHPPNSAQFSPPTWRDLELLESEIIRRILILAQSPEDEEFDVQLSTIQLIAQFLGYEVIWFTDIRTEQSFVILKENSVSESTKGWGTIVFRIGETRPWIWYVPRPVMESGTLAVASRWFDDFGGRIFFVPGSAYRADPFGRNDILSREAPRSVAHTLLSEYLRFMSKNLDEEQKAHFQSILVRGARSKQINGDLMMSTGDEIISETALETSASELLELLRSEGSDVELFSGEKHQMGLQGLGSPLAGLVRISRPGRFSTLWISDTWRASIVEGNRLADILELLGKVGIRFVFGEGEDLERWLSPAPLHAGTQKTTDGKVALYLKDYTENINAAALRSLYRFSGVYVRAMADLRATKVYLYAENKNVRCIGNVGFGGMPIADFALDDLTSTKWEHCLKLTPPKEVKQKKIRRSKRGKKKRVGKSKKKKGKRRRKR